MLGSLALLTLAPVAAAQGIAEIHAFTQLGGAVIGEGAWQPDSTPYMTWVASGGVPPLAGFSWTVDASADCSIDTVNANVQLATLADGDHTFRVRAIDGVGSCGPQSTFALRVDATGDAIVSLTALTMPSGSTIVSGVFQPDTDPLMSWSAAASAAPIAGSSYSIDAPVDCSPDTVATSVQLGVLSDGAHQFQVRALDGAGNCGPAASFDLRVDATADEIKSIDGRTSPGGALLTNGGYSGDADPFMEWTIATGSAPSLGTSWAVDVTPDCGVDTTATSAQLPLLADGAHAFRARTIDSAGNCGATSAFLMSVDVTPDPMTSLSARTAAGGAPISSGVYQTDSDPFMEWTSVAGVSPNLGFSYAVGGAADCIPETAQTSLQLAVLTPGLHEFQVRAIDAAQNCGPVATFAIAIGTPAQTIPALAPWALTALAAALLLCVTRAMRPSRT